MNILIQCAVLMIIVFLSSVIAGLLWIPVPISIVGIILLWLLLTANIIKLRYIEDVGNFFLKYMSFFFIAASVAIIEQSQLLGSILGRFSLIVIISTITTFLVTYGSVRAAIAVQNKFKSGGNRHDDTL